MKIVLLNVGNIRTGGPEAICQLSHELNQIPGTEAYIHFYTEKDMEVIDEYRNWYDIREASTTSDADVLVFPEGVDPRSVSSFEGQRWVWWLSADRHYPISAYSGCGHLFQSYFAKMRLAAYGVNGLMLTDYIREDFLSESISTKDKEDLIVFGWKGAYGALLVSTVRPELYFRALVNMRDRQVKDLMSRAKIYLDLGFHPGRDRMPREAALLDCLVVTSREGAAGNDVDVPIPEYFKRDVLKPEELCVFIEDLLGRYDVYRQDFDSYRKAIRCQKLAFRQEVRDFSLVACDRAMLKGAPSERIAALDLVLLQDEVNYYCWRNAASRLALSVILQKETSRALAVQSETNASPDGLLVRLARRYVRGWNN